MEGTAMARVRSPNYPAIGLPEAIERARKIYEKEHTHKAASDVVAKAIGYSGLNGKSLTVISALKKYGLLEEAGKDLRISQAALTILVDPPNSQERISAIRKAATEPTLFAELQKQYGDTLPSDENLRSYLLKRNFGLGAVDVPIRAYRETMSLVTGLPRENNKTPTEQAKPREKPREQVMETATGLFEMPDGEAQFALVGRQVGASIPVTNVCSVSIVANGPVTQDGLDTLKKYIDLIKPSFPKNVDEAQKDKTGILETPPKTPTSG